MEAMHERVAGLDVGKTTLTDCVRTPGPRGRRSETRTYPTTTRALGVMRDWLLERGVTIAAMESTSTYWKPAFYCLEEVLEVWLCNAAHIKAVQRPKTDVKDAEWIAQLLEHGLIRPPFVPPPEIRRLRMLTRYRVQLMGDRTRDVTRLELDAGGRQHQPLLGGGQPDQRHGPGHAHGDDRRRARSAGPRSAGQGQDAHQDSAAGRGAHRAL